MYLRRTELYGKSRVVELFEADESRYGHRYGGPVQHRGASEQEFGSRLHLLYLINTDDPRVPVRVPGVRRLPLYYCFCLDHPGMRLGYRVVSDNRIEILGDHRRPNGAEPQPTSRPEYPYDGFPTAFPERPIRVRTNRFNPLSPKHVRRYIDVFGVDSLPESDLRNAFADLTYGRQQNVHAEPERLREQLRELAHGPTCQGHPGSICPNPACPNHNAPEKLQIFAVVPAFPFGDCVEHRTLDVYSPWGERSELGCSDIDIVFEMCPLCHSIEVTNQILT